MSGNGFKMNKSQRMQLKAFICLLGFLLILILLAGKLLMAFLGGQNKKPVEPSEVEVLHNVWIMEEDDSGILIFRDGERETYTWGNAPVRVNREDNSEAEKPYRSSASAREQVADVTLTDGMVTKIVPKTLKINGRVLGADAFSVEIEGYGTIPLTEDYRGYRLYDNLEMCTTEDLQFGYSFADFCVENGKICGVLLVKEEAMEHIRVLIKTSDYADLLHVQPVLTADTGFSIIYGAYDKRKLEAHQAGEEITFSYDSPYFEGERVFIVPDVLTGKIVLRNVNRSQGIPSYRGTMELLRTEEGIAVVNEIPLEEYLYSVVPSEMPSKYPAEALKAQAICARTYAYGYMEHAGYPEYGAHVDDSTSYQVYNNILEQESTTTAVKETYGKLLYTAEGTLAGTFYYSTSCGVGSDANVWKTEAAPFITYLRARTLSKTVMAQTLGGGADDGLGEALREEEAFKAFILSKNADDFEAEEDWYRWRYDAESFDSEYLLERLKTRYAVNSKLILTLEDGEFVSREIGELGDVADIYVAKRGAGGVADELVIEGEEATYKVISEHNIRYVLNDGESKVRRQDGSRVSSPNLLPSGFFVLTVEKEDGCVTGYTLNGGGFGHGAGMSQNGAKEMAKCGWTSKDILLFFYEDCSLKCIYEENMKDA